MLNRNILGHAVSLFTIMLWGTTFVSTKVLLRSLSPIEILFYRFAIGTIALFIIYPRILKIADKKHEKYFILAGLCGVTLYFLLENIALKYSFASNVGVLVAITPFFTALLAKAFLGEQLNKSFFIGFLVAMSGIAMISFNGNHVLKLNPLGDVLAILAAVAWAFYSILVRKISSFGYNSIQTTRRIFLYGLFMMLPAMFIMNFKFDPQRFFEPINAMNILFLGLGASALGFASWSLAVKILGAVKTSVYIYMAPVVVIITSYIILHENITKLAITGTLLTLAGLVISENKIKISTKKSL